MTHQKRKPKGDLLHLVYSMELLLPGTLSMNIYYCLINLIIIAWLIVFQNRR
jgi:hypothetical protein